MVDLDTFVENCKAALADDDPTAKVEALVRDAIADPEGLHNAFGQRITGKSLRDRILYHDDELTVLQVATVPGLQSPVHNHNMWAVIGVYTGREDNIFWRRVADAEDGYIEAAGAESLGLKDATSLGRDIIHSVTNPLSKLTGAIHIYGGDFFRIDRSEWDPESHTERAYDMKKNLRLLEAMDA